MKKQAEFIVSKDMEELVEKAVRKYPKNLFFVNPAQIRCVKNITQKWKEGQPIASIQGIKGIYQLLTNYKYIIKTKSDKWDTLTDAQKSYAIIHELLHIHEDGEGSLRDEDTKDFSNLLKITNPGFNDPFLNGNLIDLINDENQIDLGFPKNIDFCNEDITEEIIDDIIGENDEDI